MCKKRESPESEPGLLAGLGTSWGHWLRGGAPLRTKHSPYPRISGPLAKTQFEPFQKEKKHSLGCFKKTALREVAVHYLPGAL